jgi:hypothetical protein
MFGGSFSFVRRKRGRRWSPSFQHKKGWSSTPTLDELNCRGEWQESGSWFLAWFGGFGRCRVAYKGELYSVATVFGKTRIRNVQEFERRSGVARKWAKDTAGTGGDRGVGIVMRKEKRKFKPVGRTGGGKLW